MESKFFLECSFVFTLLFLVLSCFVFIGIDISGYVVLDDEKGVPVDASSVEKQFFENSPISGINNLEVTDLENLVINQGDSKEIKLKIRNRGINYLNNCNIRFSQEYSSWISSEETKGLAPGEKHDFLFDLSAPEKIEKENHKIPVIISCDEINKSTDLSVNVIKKNFEIDIIDIKRLNSGDINVSYYVKEVLGESSYVEIEMIFLNPKGEVFEKINERVDLDKNSKITKNHKIDLGELNECEIKIILNVDSKKYSSFIVENILIDSEKSISGFSVSNRATNKDNVFSFLFISLFLIFSYFILRRILKYRKKVIVQE